MARRPPLLEFVAMIAILFAMIAFSTDAMLPALPEIAAELTPGAPNRAQLIITTFMLGLGLGTLVAGPMADAIGRKPVINVGIALFITGSALAYFATSLEMILMARILQGLGAAGPRIAPQALVRDLFEGRQMAQITSFIMTVFMLVPAIPPYLGSLIIEAFGWRYVFVAFVLFAIWGTAWLNIRQPETLAVEARRPIRIENLRQGFLEVIRNRRVLIFIAAMSLGFTQLLAILSSTQSIYAETFGRAESFPFWFAMSALISAGGTIVNARLVMRVGMRRLVLWAFGLQSLGSATALAIFVGGINADAAFYLWFAWSSSVFLMASFSFGNLNAMALQPLGHIAGMAASVIAAISTVVAVALAIPIGLAFDGTPLPLIFGTLVSAFVAWLLMRRTTEEEDAQTVGAE